MPLSPLLTLLTLPIPTILAAAYILQDDYFAPTSFFFDHFTFWDQADPTQGFVSYKTYHEARDAHLIRNTTANAFMGVDSENVTPYGRNSVRITSKKSYGAGLVVVDIEHMPGGICGTWPAFWMVGPNWPQGGEIDILEGVNDQTMNAVTLHTGPGCSIRDNGGFTGQLKHTGCASGGGGGGDANSNSNDTNTGCQIGATSPTTYGAGFNALHGGVYATEWTRDYISVFFFPRASLPADVLGPCPQPSTWGTPLAKFSGDCDMATAFVEQRLVFDTTFCGDWAGRTWGDSGSSCAAKAETCAAYVEGNPGAFEEAYWSVNALKVFRVDGEVGVGRGGDGVGAAVAVAAPPPLSSVQIQTGTPRVYAIVTPPPVVVVVVASSPGRATSAVAKTTFAYSTKSSGGGYAPMAGSGGDVVAGQHADTTASAERSSTHSDTGFATVVELDGRIGRADEASAKASPTRGEGGGGGEWWSTNADGTVGYSGQGPSHEHIIHLSRHKRHFGRKLGV